MSGSYVPPSSCYKPDYRWRVRARQSASSPLPEFLPEFLTGFRLQPEQPARKETSHGDGQHDPDQVMQGHNHGIEIQ